MPHFRLQALSDRPTLVAAADNCTSVLEEIASIGFQSDAPTSAQWSAVTKDQLGEARARLRDEIRSATPDLTAKVHLWS
jgi:hypothetical protein